MAYVALSASASEEIPCRLTRELLVTELRQGLAPNEMGGNCFVPAHMALTLLAEGYSPGTVRWLLREAAVAACVAAV